jgi:hypothetical protein
VIPVSRDYDMHDGSAERPVRHESNRQWLAVAITYSKDRKYDGLSIVPQSQDQKTRFQFFKYHVGASIRVCQGPRHYQASIDMVESQCAILLCSDSAQKIVVDCVEENGREPLKSELCWRRNFWVPLVVT